MVVWDINFAGLLLGMFLTIMTLSFVFKRTIIFSIAEHTLIGTNTAYQVLGGLGQLRNAGFEGLAAGDYVLIIPMILGALLLFQMSRKYAWIGRWPFTIMIGCGYGVTVTGSMSAEILGQALATIVPIAGTPAVAVGAVMIIVGTITGSAYFMFTIRHPVTEVLRRVGRVFLLVALGGAYGNMVMARSTLAYGRLLYVVNVLRSLVAG